jgi:tRNA(Ile)-lysidine synthase
LFTLVPLHYKSTTIFRQLPDKLYHSRSSVKKAPASHLWYNSAVTHQIRPAETPDSVQSILTGLDSAQKRYVFFPPVDPAGPPTPVVVAVSGGPDSVCLLHALVQKAVDWHLELHVAHLDHALRPESAAEAAFVAGLASDWSLPFHMERLATDALLGQPDGLEAAARRARYAFLLKTAINVTPAPMVPIVALAHHAGDQAETVLLNLVRGSGLRGLGGMRWVHIRQRDGRNVHIVRPLLHTQRAEIIAYLQTHGLSWCEDSSNYVLSFARNRLRHDLLPRLAQLNPAIVETLARTAEIMAAEADRSTMQDREHLCRLLLEPAPNAVLHTASQRLEWADHPVERIVLDLAQLQRLDRASQRGVLRAAIDFLAPAHEETGLAHVDFDHIEALLERCETLTRATGPHPLAGHLAWTVAGHTATRPARLSLHLENALPFLPDHPHLDEQWRSIVGVQPIPANGSLQATTGWRLTSELLPVADLPPHWRTSAQPWEAYCDADKLHLLHLTTPQTGMRFAPLGLQGQRKTVGNLFTDQKVPFALRTGWPIVVDSHNNQIIWVCGLALAQPARITEETRRVRWLRWTREEEMPQLPDAHA